MVISILLPEYLLGIARAERMAVSSCFETTQDYRIHELKGIEPIHVSPGQHGLLCRRHRLVPCPCPAGEGVVTDLPIVGALLLEGLLDRRRTAKAALDTGAR